MIIVVFQFLGIFISSKSTGPDGSDGCINVKPTGVKPSQAQSKRGERLLMVNIERL